MAVSISGLRVAIEGGPELDLLLRGLGNKLAKKVVRAALTGAAHIPLKEIKANAVSMVGGNMGSLIARSLQSRAFKRSHRGAMGRSVSLKPDVAEFIHTAKDSKYKSGKTYIPAAIEFGHDRAEPIPFMRNAFDTVKRKTDSRFFRLTKAGIIKEARKAMSGIR